MFLVGFLGLWVPIATAASWSVHTEPKKLVNGTPIIFTVRVPVRAKSLSATWLDHAVEFSYDPGSQTWNAIAGVSLATKPGSYELKLTAKTAGSDLHSEKTLAVAKAHYPNTAITVAKQYTEPSPEQLQEINRAKAIKQDYFGRVTNERQWSGDFVAPADARISDIFGSTRTFNGEVQSTHEGLDFAVPTGTPVHAVNSGTILLAQSLYFEGNCVVIDHGQGLLSLYLHLSKIDVKEGQAVKGGEVIGLSGGTGRATGPHLHLAIRWQGVYINPQTLLQLAVPR
jgi:murein DD-endopeptidase MepM/ murein hydrolase activator NlpD